MSNIAISFNQLHGDHSGLHLLKALVLSFEKKKTS